MLTLFQAPSRVPVTPEAPAIPGSSSPVIAGPAQAPVPALDVGTLNAQVRELRIELTGLQAQWDALRVQLDNMLRNNPARPGVQQKWADVGVRMAQVKGDIAFREARIAQLEGRLSNTTFAPPPGFLRRGIDPNLAMPLGMVLLITLGLPVSIAWAKRIFRGRPQPAAPLSGEYAARLDNIERAIEAVAIEVERISEGQRFVTKIFAQRQDPAAKAPAANPEAASSEPKMLGAGPVEPIVIQQRERVREKVITPH